MNERGNENEHTSAHEEENEDEDWDGTESEREHGHEDVSHWHRCRHCSHENESEGEDAHDCSSQSGSLRPREGRYGDDDGASQGSPVLELEAQPHSASQ